MDKIDFHMNDKANIYGCRDLRKCLYCSDLVGSKWIHGSINVQFVVQPFEDVIEIVILKSQFPTSMSSSRAYDNEGPLTIRLPDFGRNQKMTFLSCYVYMLCVKSRYAFCHDEYINDA